MWTHLSLLHLTISTLTPTPVLKVSHLEDEHGHIKGSQRFLRLPLPRAELEIFFCPQQTHELELGLPVATLPEKPCIQLLPRTCIAALKSAPVVSLTPFFLALNSGYSLILLEVVIIFSFLSFP